MKKFVAGFVSATIVMTSLPAVAQNLEAVLAPFPILLHGNEFQTSKPAVVINGSTYLPLRALGEALNVKVNWNDEKKRVEIGDLYPLNENVYTKDQPAPLHTAQKIEIETLIDKVEAIVCVLNTVRGDAAWNLVKQANTSNKPCDEGYEYLVATISMSVVSSQGNKVVNIGNFECYSQDNQKYEPFFTVPPAPGLPTQLSKGGHAEGYAVFKVKKTDTAPKITYGVNSDSSGGIWFNAQ